MPGSHNTLPYCSNPRGSTRVRLKQAGAGRKASTGKERGHPPEGGRGRGSGSGAFSPGAVPGCRGICPAGRRSRRRQRDSPRCPHRTRGLPPGPPTLPAGRETASRSPSPATPAGPGRREEPRASAHLPGRPPRRAPDATRQPPPPSPTGPAPPAPSRRRRQHGPAHARPAAGGRGWAGGDAPTHRGWRRPQPAAPHKDDGASSGPCAAALDGSCSSRGGSAAALSLPSQGRCAGRPPRGHVVTTDGFCT